MCVSAGIIACVCITRRNILVAAHQHETCRCVQACTCDNTHLQRNHAAAILALITPMSNGRQPRKTEARRTRKTNTHHTAICAPWPSPSAGGGIVSHAAGRGHAVIWIQFFCTLLCLLPLLFSSIRALFQLKPRALFGILLSILSPKNVVSEAASSRIV